MSGAAVTRPRGLTAAFADGEGGLADEDGSASREVISV
jgi:hypothetical protein